MVSMFHGVHVPCVHVPWCPCSTYATVLNIPNNDILSVDRHQYCKRTKRTFRFFFSMRFFYSSDWCRLVSPRCYLRALLLSARCYFRAVLLSPLCYLWALLLSPLCYLRALLLSPRFYLRTLLLSPRCYLRALLLSPRFYLRAQLLSPRC